MLNITGNQAFEIKPMIEWFPACFQQTQPTNIIKNERGPETGLLSFFMFVGCDC